MKSTFLVRGGCLLLVMVAVAVDARKRECYIDETGDKMDPNNIYKCELSQTCCKEEGKNSCCTVKETSVAVHEQLQLWGILGGLIILLGVLMWCCRHDGDCCCNGKDGRRSCCGKSCGRRPEDRYLDDDGNPIEAELTEEENEDEDEDEDENEEKKEKTKKTLFRSKNNNNFNNNIKNNNNINNNIKSLPNEPADLIDINDIP